LRAEADVSQNGIRGNSMDRVVTVTAKRTLPRSFVVATQLWFGTPSGYVSVVVLAGVMAYVCYDAASPRLTILAGLAWVTAMVPFVLAMQAWKITHWSRTVGQPVFSFDAENVTCKSGDMVTRIPWSGIKRLRLTNKTCFVYLTTRVAWFFSRSEMSKLDEAALLDFARLSNVRVAGKVST